MEYVIKVGADEICRGPVKDTKQLRDFGCAVDTMIDEGF